MKTEGADSVKQTPETVESVTPRKTYSRQLGELVGRSGLIVGFILIVVLLALARPAFMRPANLINIVRQVSVNGMLAIGETFVIILGGIDLSVGSVIALAGVLAAGLQSYYNLPMAVVVPAVFIVPILVGCVIGLINGWAVTRFRIPAFVMTLGMMTMVRGFALLYTSGQSIYGLPDWFKWIGQGDLLGVPVPVIILAVVAIAGYVVLIHTSFGQYIYAIGGNEEGARLSGVRTRSVKLWAFVICGACASLAGVVLACRLNAGEAIAGQGYELDAIAAVVIGGTSLMGGRGSVIGTILGALVIGVINNGLNLLNVPSYWQLVAKGFIIVVAVIADQLKTRG
jgi:ribose/xylose/arabinose/galactoside ABC-type transport system permease subunit